MRGSDEGTGALFSYVDVESRIRRDHPLRQIRAIANAALSALDRDFEELYPRRLGRPSIPPERLLRAMLLQAFYGIRSERQLMERIEFDLLFRWFVGLGIDEAVWDHSSFSTNPDRLLWPKRPSKMHARDYSCVAASSVSVIPVSIDPGAMALTRMPCPAHCAARSLVKWTIAALLVV